MKGPSVASNGDFQKLLNNHGIALEPFFANLEPSMPSPVQNSRGKHGVGILIHPRLEPKELHRDPEGRHIFVRIRYNGEPWDLVCVYAPCADKSPNQSKYYTRLKNDLHKHDIGPNIILAGDFNNIPTASQNLTPPQNGIEKKEELSRCDALEQFLVHKPHMGSVQFEDDNRKGSRVRCKGYPPLGEITNELELMDPFRARDANGRVCTHASKSGFVISCARLDKFYVSKAKVSNTLGPPHCTSNVEHIHGSNSEVVKLGLTDHPSTNTDTLPLPGDHSAVHLVLSCPSAAVHKV